MKVGISGKPLNKNNTSPRANAQVNYQNKLAGYEKYGAKVLVKDMPGRAFALQWEKNAAREYYDAGYEMPFHRRPK